MGLTIDSSVYIDSIVPKSRERHVRAKEVIKLVSESGIDVFEPRIFIVELVGVLSRFKPKDEVKDVLNITSLIFCPRMKYSKLPLTSLLIHIVEQ